MTISSSVLPTPKVLQVMGTLDTGGAEMMILAAAEALTGKCVMDFLVFGGHEGTLETRALNTGGRILRMGSPRELGPLRFIRDLKELLLDGRYQVVHSHINLASGLVMKAAHAARVPVRISHSHSTILPSAVSISGRAYAWFSRRMIARHSTIFAACGDEAGHQLFQANWTRGSAVVLPNGINLEKVIHTRTQRESVRGVLGLLSSERVVGMIARLTEVKNHDFMLEVLALDKSQSGNLVLLIIGEGSLRSWLEDRARELGLTSRVRFLGLRDDVPYLLGALDIVVMPSLHEGLPVSLLEAQGAGVPALVSDQVPRESDLGLGLISWLPLGEPAKWLKHLYTETPRPEPRFVREKFEGAGYDILSSTSRMIELYTDQRGQKQ